jgi:hypothetical protein
MEFRHRYRRGRRYHYPREALGLGYADFYLLFHPVPPQTCAPKPEEEGAKSPAGQQLEDEAMPDWMFMTLCVLLMTSLCLYADWAYYACSEAELPPAATRITRQAPSDDTREGAVMIPGLKSAERWRDPREER